MDSVYEEEFGMAEPEHLETMFEALSDTVNGSESFSLTPAQQYAKVVLGHSDAATRQKMVTGNEGFFSKIGDGVNAIWDYIKKMFNAIYNWFFGEKKVGKSITEQTKETINKNNETLKKWASNDAAKSEQMKEQFKSFEKGFKEMLDEVMARKMAEKMKTILALPAPEQKREFAGVVEEYVKLNRRTQQAINDLCARAIEAHDNYIKVIDEDHSAEFAGTSFETDYANFKRWSEEYKDDPVVIFTSLPKGIKRVQEAQKAQDDLLRMVNKLNSEVGAIGSSFKGTIVSKIKHLEEVLSKKELQEENRAKFNKDLKSCNLFLSLTTRHIKELERTSGIIKQLSNMIVRLFGLK